MKDPAIARPPRRPPTSSWPSSEPPTAGCCGPTARARPSSPAYLEDYAFLAHGLLRLHAATGDPKRLAQARELTDRMIADFADPEEGGFFYTADDHESLLARPKDPYDDALPSGNSVAIRNLVALAAATGEARYLDHGEQGPRRLQLDLGPDSRLAPLDARRPRRIPRRPARGRSRGSDARGAGRPRCHGHREGSRRGKSDRRARRGIRRSA